MKASEFSFCHPDPDTGAAFEQDPDGSYWFVVEGGWSGEWIRTDSPVEVER